MKLCPFQETLKVNCDKDTRHRKEHKTINWKSIGEKWKELVKSKWKGRQKQNGVEKGKRH